MDKFNDFLILLDANLSGSWWFPALLIGTGIFFTIYLGFPQFKYFRSALKIVSGKKSNSESDGERTFGKSTCLASTDQRLRSSSFRRRVWLNAVSTELPSGK